MNAEQKHLISKLLSTSLDIVESGMLNESCIGINPQLHRVVIPVAGELKMLPTKKTAINMAVWILALTEVLPDES